MKKYVAANWKMNLSVQEGCDLAKKLVDKYGKNDRIDMAICPSFILLPYVNQILSGSKIQGGAQNLSEKEKGAFTGEVSVGMLKSAGINLTILGHSERRSLYGETDEIINKKVSQAINSKMSVIFCIGETLEERESGKLEEVISSQIKNGLKGISSSQANLLTVAYEPVWAIGTGKTATPQEAQEVHSFIRKTLGELFGANVAANIRILYGGSVNESNAVNLFEQKDIDGALVGGASLTFEKYAPVLDAAIGRK